MLTEPLVADVIARALRGGASFAELYGGSCPSGYDNVGYSPGEGFP